MFQWCHNDVPTRLQQCYNDVTTMFQQCFNNVTTMLQQCYWKEKFLCYQMLLCLLPLYTKCFPPCWLIWPFWSVNVKLKYNKIRTKCLIVICRDFEDSTYNLIKSIFQFWSGWSQMCNNCLLDDCSYKQTRDGDWDLLGTASRLCWGDIFVFCPGEKSVLEGERERV